MTMSNGTAAVQLEGVIKSFGDHVAVNDLSFFVPKGVIYGFLGPNGAGKTTTLRMLIGIFYPDEGRISVLGQSNPAAVKERIGYLPEDRGIYDKMKLGELVSYFGELKGMPAALARSRADEVLVKFGLGEWRDAKCQVLSKGMAQKAQILATILHEPELVILDEPFAGLDPVAASGVEAIIRDFSVGAGFEDSAPRSLLLTEHDIPRALSLADEIVVLSSGKISFHSATRDTSVEQISSALAEEFK